jgi:dienelactone hydrolase
MSAAVACCFLLALATPAIAQQEISFLAADSIRVVAHLYSASPDDTDRPLIVAFHQAGSNGRGEYASVSDRLLGAGYDLLAVDQRSGGERFGSENLTVDGIGESTSYCAAMPDLRAAVEAARGLRPGAPLVIWGSSYSAALVLRLAAESPAAVVAALAFSPASGGPMADCLAEEVSDQIRIPVLVTRPTSEMEHESVADQAALLRKQGHTVYVADPGTHGSSMLVAERVGGDVDATWRVVLDFLDTSTAPR